MNENDQEYQSTPEQPQDAQNGYPGGMPQQPNMQNGYPGGMPQQPNMQNGYPGGMPQQPNMQYGYPNGMPQQPNMQNGYPGGMPGQPQTVYVQQVGETKKTSGCAIAAMVLGIISIVLFCLPYVNLLPALLAFIFAFVGIGQTSKGKANGLGMAVTGLILSILVGLENVVLSAGLVPSFLGYVNESKASSANSNARTLYNSASTVLNEMDTKGEIDAKDITFAVSSESSLTYNTDALDVDEFISEMEKYFSGLSDLDEYYVIVSNGAVKEVACKNNGYAGRYPDWIADPSESSDATLKELYDEAMKSVKSTSETAKTEE